jgi:hypothetical protein
MTQGFKSTFWKDMAISRALKTASQEEQVKKDFEWYQRTRSKDPEVVAEAFREEWSEVEKLIENDEDKEKLKKKFGIK